MRVFWISMSLLLVGCSPNWEDIPYKIFFIDGTKKLGYSLGGGSFIGRVDEPKHISSNTKYISVYACPEKSCSYFYIDKLNDHKFAEYDQFVFGPYTKEQFSSLVAELGLPRLKTR